MKEEYNPQQKALDEIAHKAPQTVKYQVGIDSDGCAFDTMEIKHKECFIPNIIKHWKLQPVSKYARQAGEFVNLYSQWRGINRFPALVMARPRRPLSTRESTASWSILFSLRTIISGAPSSISRRSLLLRLITRR